MFVPTTADVKVGALQSSFSFYKHITTGPSRVYHSGFNEVFASSIKAAGSCIIWIWRCINDWPLEGLTFTPVSHLLLLRGAPDPSVSITLQSPTSHVTIVDRGASSFIQKHKPWTRSFNKDTNKTFPGFMQMDCWLLGPNFRSKHTITVAQLETFDVSRTRRSGIAWDIKLYI